MEKVKEVKVLDYNGTSIRSVENDGETWLMLNNVYSALGIASVWSSKTIYERSQFCDNEIDEFSISSYYFGQAYFASPQGLYGLFERKNELETVAAFKEWFEKLEDKARELDESKQWYTIKRVAKLNGIHWRSISWNKLKEASAFLSLEVKKIFDANFERVNVYHIDAWKRAYPNLHYEEELERA